MINQVIPHKVSIQFSHII